MQKHIKRVGGGLVATAVFAVGLLVTDIPKTLEQMDRSFAFIAQSLGYGSPPRHFISDAWGHPWVILLAFVAVFALGVAVSSGIERLYGRFRARPPTGPQPLYLLGYATAAQRFEAQVRARRVGPNHRYVGISRRWPFRGMASHPSA